MGITEIVLIGIGLSMDAACVSMADGMCYKLRLRMALCIGLVFGVFQGAMPIIGYYCGLLFSKQISGIDHWVALILLSIIGGKMLVDGIKDKNDTELSCNVKPFTMKMLFVQGVATSIDALAVGVSFVAMSVNIWLAASIIAACTFALSVGAVFLGKKIGTALSRRAEIFGGTILVVIGVKIFLEHVLG